MQLENKALKILLFYFHHELEYVFETTFNINETYGKFENLG